MITKVKSMMIHMDVSSSHRKLEPDSWLTWEASFRLARVLGLSKAFGFRLVSYTDLLNTMTAICNKYMYDCVTNNYNNIDERQVHVLQK